MRIINIVELNDDNFISIRTNFEFLCYNFYQFHCDIYNIESYITFVLMVYLILRC